MKKILAVIAVALAASVSSYAQLAGTTVAASGISKSSATLNGSISGTNSTATGGNYVQAYFYWGNADCLTTNGSWQYNAPAVQSTYSNGSTFSLQAGGMQVGQVTYFRAYVTQADSGSNIYAWGATSFFTNTAGANPYVTPVTLKSLVVTGMPFTVAGVYTVTNSAGAAIKVIGIQ